MRVLLIDNYDSFVFNLVQIIEHYPGTEVTVLRNDAYTLDDLSSYDKIILSPGPGLPEEAGLLLDTIRRYGPHKPILGVCLGLQAIGQVYGAQLRNLHQVYHGIQSPIHRTEHDSPLFAGLPAPFYAGRYHSWVIDAESDISQLVITSTDQEGQIMSARHRTHPVYGVQFHPESILTPEGALMIHNFLGI